MSDEAPKSSPSGEPKKPELKVDVDPRLNDLVQGGAGAVKNIFAGFVKLVKDAVGPELMRNLQASSWLEQVAVCLDGCAADVRTSGECSPEKTGELSFFGECLEQELKGSKVERQRELLQQKLCAAIEIAVGPPASDRASSAKQLASTAGFFHAAAKSAAPPPRERYAIHASK